MNSYESGTQKVIPAVLVYVKSQGQVLMLHRKDGIWNGLGGKCDLNESIYDTAQREVLEESGLKIDVNAFRFLGFLQFPNFKAQQNEDWLVSVFIAHPDAKALKDLKMSGGPEGDLRWVPAPEISKLKTWPGDRLFLDYIEKEVPFAGTIWYQDGQVVRHRVAKI